jgi:hypothetical protein
MSVTFDPRATYLRGLGAGPSARALVGRRRYNRNFIGAFDPRQRYLHGMGDDIPIDVAPLPTQLGPDPIYSTISTETPIPFLPTLFGSPSVPVTYQASAPPINFVPSGSVPTAPTAAQISMAASGARPLTPSILGPSIAATPSWLNQTNPTLGISNTTLLLGFGVVMAVMLAGSGGRRR